MKHSQRIRPARRRGFSLTELLLCLSMMSVAGLVAIRLFDQSMHVIQANAQDPTVGLDQMGQILRTDVWAAKQIEMTGDKTADLTTGDGTRIRWQLDSQKITRTATSAGAATPPSSREWSTPIAFTAERHDHALVLHAGSDQWRFTAPAVSEGSP